MNATELCWGRTGLHTVGNVRIFYERRHPQSSSLPTSARVAPRPQDRGHCSGLLLEMLLKGKYITWVGESTSSTVSSVPTEGTTQGNEKGGRSLDTEGAKTNLTVGHRVMRAAVGDLHLARPQRVREHQSPELHNRRGHAAKKRRAGLGNLLLPGAEGLRSS